jgi:hypothetical protein
VTSDNAQNKGAQGAGSTSDNTKPVGVPTAQGVAFHYCPALGDAPACGRVPASALQRHVALPAADVPPDLRCRFRGCRTAYEALDQDGADEALR